MKHLCQLSLLCVVCVGGTGCLSARSLESARTLERGKYEVAVGSTAHVTGVFPGDRSTLGIPVGPSTTTSGIRFLPSADVGIRYGVQEDLEVRVLVGLSGLTGGAKFQLYRGDRLALAFNPTVSGALLIIPGGDVVGGFIFLEARAPLLFGVLLGGGHELVLAPVIAAQSLGYGGVSFFTGGALGVRLHVTDKVRIMPELSVSYPLTPSITVFGTDSVPRLQASLGVSWVP